MRSKSEAGKTLDRINHYVGVANDIFMDDAPGKTGYNTEIHIVESLTRTEVRTTEPHSP